MAVFDDREKGEEAKFAHDQEAQFRIRAHRNKLLALWAAEKLTLTEADTKTYVADVLAIALEKPGDDALLQKVRADLTAAGLGMSEDEVRREMKRLTEQATEDITGKRPQPEV